MAVGVLKIRNASDTDWIELGGSSEFPSGTKQWFYQAAAPTGWTIDSTLGDRVLAVHGTSPYSGSTGGGQQQGGWTISGLTHAHTHNVYVTASTRTGTVLQSSSASQTFIRTAGSQRSWADNVTTTTAAERYKRETTYSISTTAVSADGNWRPAANVGIIASKD